jgi:hypothetical protein
LERARGRAPRMPGGPGGGESDENDGAPPSSLIGGVERAEPGGPAPAKPEEAAGGGPLGTSLAVRRSAALFPVPVEGDAVCARGGGGGGAAAAPVSPACRWVSECSWRSRRAAAHLLVHPALQVLVEVEDALLAEMRLLRLGLLRLLLAAATPEATEPGPASSSGFRCEIGT